MTGGQCYFAGLSQVSYSGEAVDLGHGVMLRPTYAHLFSHPMIAFAPSEGGKPHPGPWKPASGGGFAHDIGAELVVPRDVLYPSQLPAEGVVAIIVAVLRLAHPYLQVPVIADVSFSEAANSSQVTELTPVETMRRRIAASTAEISRLKEKDLQWLRTAWPKAAELSRSSGEFDAAIHAVGECAFDGRASSSLLIAWGALEGLFAKGSRSEIRHRVSAYISAFLEPTGPRRLALFQEVKALYDARSRVAHSSKDAEDDELLRTFVILRNAVLEMLQRGSVPSSAALERMLFEGSDCGG